MRQELPVPDGFAIRTEAYCDHLAATGLDGAIRAVLARVDSLDEQSDAARRIAGLFAEHGLLPPCRDELTQAYRDLGEPPVAVRSSAISEDAIAASFAGEHESYLWIKGADAIGRAVVRCWASLFTPRALAYFRRVDIVAHEAAMGVVVQSIVPAQAAGVMFTIDPVTGDRSQIVIEGSLGLGQAVVAGEVTPDRWTVDKVMLEIRSRTLARKHVAYRFDRAAGEVRAFDVPPEDQGSASLSDDEVVEIASLGKAVERALAAPQDIEWALGPAREVYLVQTRPETVWSRRLVRASAASTSAALAGFARAMSRSCRHTEGSSDPKRGLRRARP
jgi:pyruvate,water dikinase